jgi:peptidoglycan/LPS O-acetylase OafA/YrhL
MKDKFWFLTYAMNVRIGLDHGLRPDLPFSVHLWSMGVEEQFYFVWPFLVLLLRRRQLMVLCALAVLFSVVTRTLMYTSGYHHWISYSFTPARLDCLAIGSFVALAMRDANDFRRMVPWLRTLTMVSIPTIIAFSLANGQFDPFDPWGRVISHTLIGFIFASVIIAIITAPQGAGISRFFGNRVFTRLGTYSYTMYLWHLLVGYIFFEYFAVWDNIPTIAGSSLPGLFAFMIVAGVPTYLIGWVSWNYFEGPILRMKRYFKYDTSEPKESREQLRSAPASALAARPAMES